MDGSGKDALNLSGGSDPTFGGTLEPISKGKLVKTMVEAKKEEAKTSRTYGQAETTNEETSTEDPNKKN